MTGEPWLTWCLIPFLSMATAAKVYLTHPRLMLRGRLDRRLIAESAALEALRAVRAIDQYVIHGKLTEANPKLTPGP